MTKKQFLNEHNKLSPSNLQATFVLLTRFQQEKKPTLKDDEWSMDKLRPSLIIWLSTLSREESRKSNDQSGYKNYPQTKFQINEIIYMKNYISKKIQRAKLNFQNFRSKTIVRVFNLAKRLDQSHSKDEKKKQKSNQNQESIKLLQ